MELVNKQRRIAAQLESVSRPDPIELSDIIQRVKRDVLDEFPDSEIEMDIDLSTNMRISPQIELALFELLTNALEHSDMEPPWAAIHVQIGDDELCIQVIDTGPGIPRMDIDVLGTEEEPLFHSRGLGLWIAYWIVTHAGGSLEFDDNEPRGTIVTIRLPREMESHVGLD